jgi:hypothetical protein
MDKKYTNLNKNLLDIKCHIELLQLLELIK